MDKDQLDDIALIRQYIHTHGLSNASIEEAEKQGINAQEIFMKYGSLSNLAEKILEHERKSFEQIFSEYDFDELNAIDILLIVAQEINHRFSYVSPTTTIGLKRVFPQIYEKHVQQRLEFVYDKIQINIKKGIKQKVYKHDVSVEMMARLYVSRLNEIHDPEIYPTADFTYATVFSKLIRDFIYNIATRDGIHYYKQRKQLYSVLSFGR